METEVFWVGIFAAVALAFVPLPETHQFQSPSPEEKYIRRAYAEHTVGQNFHTDKPVDEVRLLLRSEQPLTANLELKDETGTIRGKTSAHLSPWESWVSFGLAYPFPPGNHQITLHAPGQTLETSALARFEIDSSGFRGGHMVVNGKESYGDLAFQLVDHLPIGLWAARWVEINMRVVLLAVALAGILFNIPADKKSWRIALVMLFLAAFLIRLPLLWQIEGVHGGDAWNYLLKTNAWLSGEDPFGSDPRKGPFLPFLLLPALLVSDPLLFSRVLGIVFAAAASVVLALMLRRLKVTPGLAIGGGMLLAVSRDFWWESANALSNIPFAAFLIAAAYALLLKAPVAVTVLSSLAALTRFEGFISVMTLIPAAIINSGRMIKSSFRVAVPLTVLLAIPWLMAPFTGQSGVRSLADIKNDSGLYIAWDSRDYVNNLKRFRTVSNSFWVLGVDKSSHYAGELLTAAAIAGAALLLYRRPRFAVPVTIMLAILTASVVGILPKSRYFTYLIPFAALSVTYLAAHLPRRTALPALCLLIAFSAFNAHRHMGGLLEQYNEAGRLDAALIEGARYLQPREGSIAVSGPWLPLKVFLDPERTIDAPERKSLADWIEKNRPTYLFEVSKEVLFTPLIGSPGKFEHVFHLKKGDPVVDIYRVKY